MQFKDLRYVIKSVWSFTLCFAVFRWCWTAQPCPVCFTSSAVLKSPFVKRHAGPSQTSQQETEHKYRYHTLSSFLSVPEERLCGSTLVFAKLSVKFVFWDLFFFFFRHKLQLLIQLSYIISFIWPWTIFYKLNNLQESKLKLIFKKHLFTVSSSANISLLKSYWLVLLDSDTVIMTVTIFWCKFNFPAAWML